LGSDEDGELEGLGGEEEFVGCEDSRTNAWGGWFLLKRGWGGRGWVGLHFVEFVDRGTEFLLDVANAGGMCVNEAGEGWI
jgi:hypothetical protein